VIVDADGWSIRTLDGAVAAHAEHTIVVDRRGARVLTRSRSASTTRIGSRLADSVFTD
jgi:methionyl aminopeptidase